MRTDDAMRSPENGTELRDTWIAVEGGDDSRRDELRRRICELVDSLKDEGLPAETILARVKAIFARFPASSLAISRRDADERRRALLTDAVQWCIRRYYEAD
jgi:hypothetical protein